MDISAWIDLISSELWNGIQIIYNGTIMVNAEKEAVQDTVRTYFIEHQHLQSIGLRSTFFCKPESTSDPPYTFDSVMNHTRNQWATYG